MAITAAEKNLKASRMKDDYWDAIPTLPRQYRITLEDVGLGEYAKMASQTSPSSLAQAMNLSGPIGNKARKAIEYLKEYILELMRYDDELWRDHQTLKNKSKGIEKIGEYRWQTGIIPSAAGSGAPHIMNDHWINEVNNHFEDLLPFIRFFDPAEARRRYLKLDANSADATLQSKLESETRQHALTHMNKWKERFVGGAKAGPKSTEIVPVTVKFLEGKSRGELLKMLVSQAVNWKEIGERHDINVGSKTKLDKGELVTILSDHYGLLGQFIGEEV